MTSLVWFRDDLRLADNPALHEASTDRGGVVCLYIHDQETPGIRQLGGAAQWWLHHSLTSLQQSLNDRGMPLILRKGPTETVLAEVVAETSADSVYWNRRYGLAERTIDASLKSSLRASGLEVRSFAGSLLREPSTVHTGAGTPYRVYSAYWRACRELPSPRHPLPLPERLEPAPIQPRSDELDDWNLLPQSPNWAAGFTSRWMPGEPGAETALNHFLDRSLDGYATGRDYFAADATSNLSPHLRWGEISPFTVWHRAAPIGGGAHKFLTELGWREFAWYTLFHHPDLAEVNINPRFDRFPWAQPEPEILTAWRTGTTGVPVVDAGMRELWATGSMHNRARMITASFLTKNLLYDWRIGEKWFWDTLVDADPASNPFNWQWIAGSGMDAAPYFRIFNPLTQQKKYDPRGEYVQRWAGDSSSREPVVDIDSSRRRALSGFRGLSDRKA